jgi:hypothetical protein
VRELLLSRSVVCDPVDAEQPWRGRERTRAGMDDPAPLVIEDPKDSAR